MVCGRGRTERRPRNVSHVEGRPGRKDQRERRDNKRDTCKPTAPSTPDGTDEPRRATDKEGQTGDETDAPCHCSLGFTVLHHLHGTDTDPDAHTEQPGNECH